MWAGSHGGPPAWRPGLLIVTWRPGLASWDRSVVQGLDHAWTETMPNSLPDPLPATPGTTPDPAESTERVLVLDFGSQVTQLIARRLRESGVYCEIWPFNADPARISGLPRQRLYIVRRTRQRA